MSNAVSERASAIRHHLRDHPDRALVRRYSFVASRYEQLKLAQIDGNTTPADDVSFSEVTQMLRVLTRQLGLGENITYANGYLINDPQRILTGTWLDCARLWFG